jgi:hypothetical protein
LRCANANRLPCSTVNCFRAPCRDPLFNIEAEAITRLEEIAWQTYSDGRKSPIASKAGARFADPDYGLSVEWLATKERLEKAQALWAEPESPTRVLLMRMEMNSPLV